MKIDILTEQILEITNNSNHDWIDLDSAEAERIRLVLTEALNLGDVIQQIKQLVCNDHHADLEHFMNYSESICKTCKQKV